MEIIPKHIEDKIANLPIVSMTDQEGIQAVLESQDFIDVFAFYKAHYLPENLQSKPDIVQKVSLYLNLTNQGEDYIQQSEELIYRRPVPAIEEFLTNKFYMGYANASLYPYWRKQLCKIFQEGSAIRKVIFGGSIGSGKSTIARKAFIYVLYRILCLRDARAAFNIDPDATIANVVMSVTLKQVYETNLLPFVKLMESMPCFQRVQSQRSFEAFDLTDPRCPVPFVVEKSTGNIYFPENIILTCGSQATHFVGMNVVNSFCFTGNTKVWTDKGIITFNELVNRFNNCERFKTKVLDCNGNYTLSNIINALETTKTKELIRIYYDDENYIECTPTHPFIIKNPDPNDINIKYENGIPYKQAQYLTEEDELYDTK